MHGQVTWLLQACLSLTYHGRSWEPVRDDSDLFAAAFFTTSPEDTSTGSEGWCSITSSSLSAIILVVMRMRTIILGLHMSDCARIFAKRVYYTTAHVHVLRVCCHVDVHNKLSREVLEVEICAVEPTCWSSCCARYCWCCARLSRQRRQLDPSYPRRLPLKYVGR